MIRGLEVPVPAHDLWKGKGAGVWVQSLWPVIEPNQSSVMSFNKVQKVFRIMRASGVVTTWRY